MKSFNISRLPMLLLVILTFVLSYEVHAQDVTRPKLIPHKTPAGTERTNIEDGFYLVLNTFQDKASVQTTTGKLIPYSHDFLDENISDQPMYLEIQTSEYVPMSLSKAPEGIEQEDKRIHLMLSMTEEGSAALENFTEKYLNKKTCIVIGGEAVTIHKVREKITGGNLQVTRCTDNACKHLLLELQDNIQK